jgi:hypothetical protein
MSQESPLCRFCLDSNNGKWNPLIEPCECRGSLRFVHKQCLSRWRRINPARNANMCMLCLEPYIEAYNDALEMIPDTSTLSAFLLRFPFLTFLTVNYIGVFHYTVVPFKPDVLIHFSQYQIVSQIAYFLLFFSCWKVRNTRKYWHHWYTQETFLVLGFHGLCNYYICTAELFACVPLLFVMNCYWPRHLAILQTLNRN